MTSGENIRWAVVTGASAGIGWELARRLSADGYSVLAVARRRDRLEQLAAEARAGGRVIEPFAADLQSMADRERLVQKALALPGLELLVNNAGYASYGRFTRQPLDRELGIVRLNIEALVHLTHALLPEFLRRGRGGVINIGSQQGFQPLPYFSTYNATKAFVLFFSENLSEELRGSGVRILVVCPGPVKTEFADVSGDHQVHGMVPNLTAAEVAQAALNAWKNRRVVKIVGWVNFLQSMLPRFLPRFLARRVSGLMLRPGD
jgi:short-subunit dehydrogenase